MCTEQDKALALHREMYLAILPEMTHGVFLHASEGIKALLLISGGSAAALLAFMGHLVSIQNAGMAKMMAPALLFFLGAGVASSACFCFSYLAQLFFNLYAEYIFIGHIIQKHSRLGYFFQIAAIVSMTAAFVLCLLGIWRAYLAFMQF